MVDLIYPASNGVLFLWLEAAPTMNRTGLTLRHSALTLAESGNVLTMRRPGDQGDWMKDARIVG